MKEEGGKPCAEPCVGRELFKIPLGLYATGEDYLVAIGAVLKQFSVNAGRVIGALDCSPVKNELRLWGVSEEDLGFSDGADPEDVWLALEEIGLKRCPIETAPSTCVCSALQSGSVAFCTEPLRFKSGSRHYFCMDHAGLYTFSEDDVDPKRVWVAVWPMDDEVRYIADTPPC